MDDPGDRTSSMMQSSSEVTSTVTSQLWEDIIVN
jgi:hypothetical protein